MKGSHRFGNQTRTWRTHKRVRGLLPVSIEENIRTGARGPLTKKVYEYCEEITLTKQRASALAAMLFPEYSPPLGRPRYWADWRLVQLLTLVEVFEMGGFATHGGRGDKEAAFKWLAEGRYLEDWVEMGGTFEPVRDHPLAEGTLRRRYMEAKGKPHLVAAAEKQLPARKGKF